MNTFVSELLKYALSLEDFPLVDRAHRALLKRSNGTEPPRSLIVRLHYFRDVTTILRKAIQRKDLTFNGQKIHVFPDFTPEVANRRAAFNRARAILRDKPGVRYGTVLSPVVFFCLFLHINKLIILVLSCSYILCLVIIIVIFSFVILRCKYK